VISNEQKKSIGLEFVLEKIICNTPYGAEKVRNLKLYKSDESHILTNELENVKKVLDNLIPLKDEFDSLERGLMQFKEIRNSVKKISREVDGILDEIELFEIKNFLLALEKTVNIFDSMNREIDFIDIGFKQMEEALNLLDPEKQRISSFYISDTYSEELKQVRVERKKLENEILNKAQNSDELKRNRLEIVCREDELVTGIKIMITKKLGHFASDFNRNIENVGKLDFIIQKGKLAREFKAVYPRICDDKLKFENVFNPHIEHILNARNKQFTKISICLENRTTLLTGANMGGKSVALKTFILNVLMFQMGFFVFADSAEIPIFENINLISEDLQDVDKGLSTFGAEIIKLQSIIFESRKGLSFIALDEFARGTNPKEGAILVRSVAQYFNDKKNTITLITTHYDLEDVEQFDHYQVVGLKNVDMSELKQKIKLKASKSMSLIAEYMDYSLEKSSGDRQIPKDALNICKLLSIDENLLKIIESNNNF